MLTSPLLTVSATALTQILLWRDKRNAAKAESESLQDSLGQQESDLDEKKAVRAEVIPVTSLD
jgi:hypothetical protein